MSVFDDLLLYGKALTQGGLHDSPLSFYDDDLPIPTTIKTGLPTATWRLLNQGIAPMPKRQPKPVRRTKTQQLEDRIKTQEALLAGYERREQDFLHDTRERDAQVASLHKEIADVRNQLQWFKSMNISLIELATSVAKAR